MDPTSRGDIVAEKVRRWYEANRETWWGRHKPGADRYGLHADEFMLRLIATVQHFDRETPPECGTGLF